MHIPISVIRDIEGPNNPTVITVRIADDNGREFVMRSYTLSSRVTILHDGVELSVVDGARLRLEFHRGTSTESFQAQARAVVKGANHIVIIQRDEARINVKINHLASGECELSCPQTDEVEVGRHGDCKACATPYGPIVICC
jgi:hypothetical protein